MRSLIFLFQKTLTWGPWILYKTTTAGSKTLAVCDYFGEKLANFFGITSPKYEYEIDFYETMKQEVNLIYNMHYIFKHTKRTTYLSYSISTLNTCLLYIGTNSHDVIKIKNQLSFIIFYLSLHV